MSQDPPPEFQRVSRAQVLRADRQCFLELARVCNGNLKPGPDGALPVDKEFEKLEFNTSVMYFLLPVKGRGKGGGKQDRDGKGRKRKTHGDEDSPGKKAKITRDPIPEVLKGMLIVLGCKTQAGVNDAREKAWSAGAYSQGTLCGLRRNTRTFPNAVRAAVRLLRARFPHATFATVAIYSNVCTPMHRDANNLEGTANYMVPVTSFGKGGIWIQDDKGPRARATPLGKANGRVLQVCEGPVEFDARRYHCTLPWEGSRVVLVGFTPNRISSLKDDEVTVLKDLGFPVPGHPVTDACATTSPCANQPCKSGEHDPGVSAGQPLTPVTFGLRRKWLDKWTARAAEITKAPDPSWDISDPHMHHVLCKKRLQLLDEIIAAEGYEDVNLARDIWSGFDLVGKSPVSNVLPLKVTPASLHPDDLQDAAPRANEALKISLGSSGERYPAGVPSTLAYRQLCVAVRSRGFAAIAVYNPHKQRTELFTQICLPFGSRASVNGFIRCSRCIQWIANRCLLVPTTSYYDDFIVASPDCLADNTGTTMELLFQLLGWIFDLEGPKADVFSRQVSALGLHFDLEASGDGIVTVGNTEKRRGDLRTLVESILEEGALSYKGGLELRGKLSFASSQIMGKAGHYALKHISSHVHAWPFVAKLTAATRDALNFLLERIILHGEPRRITKPLGHPWFVFTDASFEPCFVGGLGGVLISPSGSVASWFGLPLCEGDIRPLLPVDASTGIGELETVAVVVAFMLWSQRLSSAECIAYLDNEEARFALIKGYSASWAITRICHIFVKTCEQHTLLPWCARERTGPGREPQLCNRRIERRSTLSIN
ncbi:unnamed protein product [Symbiodinium sp. CCMP2592]|nr:unnamed protein product [Symbiodinium sp. CCMP2592]